MRLFARCTTLGAFLGCALAGCASSRPAGGGGETALSCDALDVAVPDVARLPRTDLGEEDLENSRRVEAAVADRLSRTGRWSGGGAFAIQVRSDGSVARACVVSGSDFTDRDRIWLDAIMLAQFREGRGNTGRWLRFDLGGLDQD